MDSSDEALCEILGLTSLDEIATEIDSSPHSETTTTCNKWGLPSVSSQDITLCLQNANDFYNAESVCMVPRELSIPAATMRKLTEEIVWDPQAKVNRTYETIKVLKHGQVEERRVLTRLENFVNYHEGWKELCYGHLQKCISAILGMEMVLYKEKLNLKPPGGSGFAPHLDSPSLRVALGDDGPQTFVTVMVAIDNMSSANGCLRICKGPWNEDHHCQVIPPDQDGNPDAGGRAGAIPVDVAETLDFEDLVCQGGDIFAFNGFAPHRSSSNVTPFPRRAVFLTYNPRSQGDFHDRYYQRMENIRNEWRNRVGLGRDNSQLSSDEQTELEALSTIPRI